VPRLTKSEIDAFLDERHTLVIATHRRDGSAHLTTVWYRWDGDAFWISTNRDRAKYLNIARDPRVSVLVDAPPRETSVAATGMAEVVAQGDDAYDGALAIVGRYVDDAAGYLAERHGEPRALIRIRPERMTSWKPD
jgi:PPOX class probable F420-dependent enzyme